MLLFTGALLLLLLLLSTLPVRHQKVSQEGKACKVQSQREPILESNRVGRY